MVKLFEAKCAWSAWPRLFRRYVFLHTCCHDLFWCNFQALDFTSHFSSVSFDQPFLRGASQSAFLQWIRFLEMSRDWKVGYSCFALFRPHLYPWGFMHWLSEIYIQRPCVLFVYLAWDMFGGNLEYWFSQLDCCISWSCKVFPRLIYWLLEWCAHFIFSKFPACFLIS